MKSTSEKNVNLFFAIGGLFLFFIFFAFSIFSLYNEYKDNFLKGDKLADEITRQIKGTYIVEQQFSSSIFKKKINRFFSDDKHLCSIVIRDKNNSMLYIHAVPGILKKDCDFTKNAEYSDLKKHYAFYTKTVSDTNETSLKVEIIYRTDNPERRNEIIKVASFYLLAFIIILMFMVIFQRKKVISSINSDEKVINTISSDILKTDITPVHLCSMGFGHKMTFEEYLVKELEIATSENKDLVLASFKYIVIPDNELVKETLKAAESVFYTTATLFDEKDEYFNLVLVNKSLEEGIENVKKFITKVDEFSQENVLLSGLSSRNRRNISCELLLAESKAALAKADIDNPIVALGTDPEKFQNLNI